MNEGGSKGTKRKLQQSCGRSLITFNLNADNHDLSSLKKTSPLVDEEEAGGLKDRRQQRVLKSNPEVESDNESLSDPDANTETNTGSPYGAIEGLITKELLALRKTIKLYIDWFPIKLKDFKNIDVESIGTEQEAKDIIDRTKFQLSASNVAAFNKMFLQTGIELTESIGSAFGWKLQGLSIVTSNNPDIEDILKEIALDSIENGWFVQDPYRKLGALLLFEAGKVHNSNISRELATLLRRSIVSEELVNKFRDI